jgi:hypothetical protein
MNDSEFQRGVSDAKADVENGGMRYFFQTRGFWGKQFTDLMQARFRVQVIHVSDMTSDAETSYVQGYNTTIESHLDHKFEPGAFNRTWSEIKAYREEGYQQWRDSQGTA